MFNKIKSFFKKNSELNEDAEKLRTVDVDEILESRQVILGLQQTTYHPYQYDPTPYLVSLQEEMDLHLEKAFNDKIDADNGDLLDEFLVEKYLVICDEMSRDFTTHRQLLDKLFRGYTIQASTAKNRIIPKLIEERAELINKKQVYEQEISEIEGRNRNGRNVYDQGITRTKNGEKK